MTGDRDSRATFDAAALAEDVDLDRERRERILAAEARIGQGTMWEALGLAWNAPVEAVRDAYLEAVKIFHPDRYAGKRLGSYRARLERVFRNVTAARDLLVDEARRADYARRTAPATEFTKMEARRLEDERRAAERRARLARTNPLVARASRVGELAARGKAALQAGNFRDAAADLALAQSMDPGNAELAALAAVARQKGAAQRVGEHLERAAAEEAMGAPARALAAYRAALEADPRSARAAVGGARTALQLGDLPGARQLAEAAVRVAPGLAAAHEALGLVLEAQGEKREARRALERALELDPRLEQAKERLRKLRWGILG